jgi:hypothetical protein
MWIYVRALDNVPWADFDSWKGGVGLWLSARVVWSRSTCVSSKISWIWMFIDVPKFVLWTKFLSLSLSLSLFFLGATAPQWAMASYFTMFIDHTQWRTTLGRTPLDEWSTQRPLPNNKQHSRQTDIHAPGGIRTHNLSRRAAADLRLWPRGTRDRHLSRGVNPKSVSSCC